MIDHITFGVKDLDRSILFYSDAFAPFGVRLLHEETGQDGVRVAGYGVTRPSFWLAEERAVTGLLHIAFAAPTRAAVDAFHAAALQAGGVSNGPPGLRPHYHADYYAAFVLDPDGHNVEAVRHSPVG